MEETVGLLWHRLITRAAGGHFPKAAVKLKEIEKVAGVFFRALGGDPGLRVAAATSDGHGARRSLLQRIAGADERISRGRMDIATLRLQFKAGRFHAGPGIQGQGVIPKVGVHGSTRAMGRGSW